MAAQADISGNFNGQLMTPALHAHAFPPGTQVDTFTARDPLHTSGYPLPT